MKIISKKYCQDMVTFVEQISIKFGSFYVIKMNLVHTVLYTCTLKYWWKSLHWQIFKRLNIHR